MNAEIISVGTELLLGEIVDTNAAFLARTLAGLGVNVYYKSVVGDNGSRLASTLRLALSRSDLVVLGGGLGPTRDDLTRETVAETLGVPLVLDTEAESRMREFFKARGVAMPETNVRQAMGFEGGTVLQNDHGTAPGLVISRGGKTVILLPGPPQELIPMVEASVVPLLRRMLGPDSPVLHSRVVRVAGLGESLAAERLGDLLDSPNPTVAPYAKAGEVHLRVMASGPEREARALVEAMVERVAARLEGHVFGFDEDTLESVLLERLRAKGLSLAGAESCTGGAVSDRITGVPGSSDVFLGSITAYANSAKEKLLHVPAATIREYGAVSAETASAMAEGAARVFGADVAYSVTGIAGPGGGTERKPVGLVFIAVAGPGGTVVAEHRFRGRRDAIKRSSAQAALTAALRCV